MKRIITLMLALMLVVMLLASCNNDDIDGPAITDTVDPNAPAIPSDINLSGDFLILNSGNMERNDFEGSADSKTTIGIAIYHRNELLKQNYGINVITEDVCGFGTSNGNGIGFQKLYSDYMAGTSTYDAAMAGTADLGTLASTGMLWDLSSLPNMDLSKPYWDPKANEDLAIGGKMFYTTGDISVIDNTFTHALLFNKDIIKAYSLDNPYDLVRNNEWTIENFGRLVKSFGEDVGGDGIYDENDKYGLLTFNDAMAAILVSSREKIASVNDSGELEITLFNERVVNLYDKVDDIFFDHVHTFNYQYDKATGRDAPSSQWDIRRDKMFNEGRALFYTSMFSGVERYRDSEIDFGILPYPKYDSAQDEYGHSISCFRASFFCIPLLANPERSSAVAELLAYYGKEYLTPAYYEKTLCGKYVRDAESTEMLDIIFASRVYDVGAFYEVGGYSGALTKRYVTRNSISNMYETYRQAAELRVEKVNSSFAKLTDSVVYSSDVEYTEAPVDNEPVDLTPYNNATVVYLSNNGKGNGSSATSAVNSITAALDCLDLSKDCTVVVCGPYMLSEKFVYSKTFDGTVTITSNYDGVDYRENGAVILASEVRFVCSGKYVFNDLTFELMGKGFTVVANHYPLVFDNGISISSMSDAFNGIKFASSFSIVGGYLSGQPVVLDGEAPSAIGDMDTNITINSGSGYWIGAYSFGMKNAEYKGTATVNVGGDANVQTLWMLPVNAPFTCGSTVVNISGNAIVSDLYGANNTGTSEKATVNWMSGSIGAYRPTNSEQYPTYINGVNLIYSETVMSDSNFESVAAAFDTATKQ